MTLIQQVLKEKEDIYNDVRNKREFCNKVKEIMDSHVEDIKLYFGKSLVFFEEKSVILTIEQNANDHYLKLNKIEDFYQFSYSAEISGERQQTVFLEKINQYMEDKELKKQIELSMKYLLRKVLK